MAMFTGLTLPCIRAAGMSCRGTAGEGECNGVPAAAACALVAAVASQEKLPDAAGLLSSLKSELGSWNNILTPVTRCSTSSLAAASF